MWVEEYNGTMYLKAGLNFLTKEDTSSPHSSFKQPRNLIIRPLSNHDVLYGQNGLIPTGTQVLAYFMWINKNNQPTATTSASCITSHE